MSPRGKENTSPGEVEVEVEDVVEAEREILVDEEEAAGEVGGQVQRDAEAATSSRQIWMRCCFVSDGSERDILAVLYVLRCCGGLQVLFRTGVGDFMT